MTEEQMRIKLAEWDGLRKIRVIDKGYKTECLVYRHYFATGCEDKIVPNYPNDLNAIHELEKKLSFSQRMRYTVNLQEIMGEGKCVVALGALVFATAIQKCEALIRTLDL